MGTGSARTASNAITSSRLAHRWTVRVHIDPRGLGVIRLVLLLTISSHLPVSSAWSLRLWKRPLYRVQQQQSRSSRLFDSESPPTSPRQDDPLLLGDSFASLEDGETKISTAPDSNQLTLDIAKQENERLREQIYQLEQENQALKRKAGGSKIILEMFEGGRVSSAAKNKEWYKDASSRKSPPMEDNVAFLESEGDTMPLWCDELDDGTCPIEPTVSFLDALKDRATWLIGLLAFQSCSGFILARNEALLENHPTIIYFLTMLVGAGGNAGNQASVRVIRGLALGTLNESTQAQFLWRELKMGIALSGLLSVAGFCRAAAFRTPFPETVAVTCALSFIVFSSICLGAVLPLLLKRIGVDPAHSSTTIQVVMDILGVVFTVLVSSAILDSKLGQLLITRLSF